MVFSFATPVSAFGAHVLDDSFTNGTYQLSVTEVGGAVYTSSVLDAQNGNFIWPEGFLGVTSSVGLVEVEIVQFSPSGVGFFHVEPELAVPSPPVPALGDASRWGLAVLLLVIALGWIGRDQAARRTQKA